ncbi:MAG TPA: glycosyltransferase [Candidatus Woesebacteria bacterium]|nr:glycosyltransferase [Candidatus Woesebacteria bacterium]
MKIAIVYDWIDKWGGVERLLLTLHAQYPDADWYTSYYDKKNAPWAKNLRIKTSFINKLPTFIKKNRILSLLLYPYAFESFDLSGYDVVISISSSFAKGVITKPNTKHICYLLTPTRYLWGMIDVYIPSWIQTLCAPIITKLQKWDFIAAQRPDIILTLSKHVAKRCVEYYKREAVVVYPPFDSNYWRRIKESLLCHPESSSGSFNAIKMLKRVQHNNDKDYYLLVSRLEPYKKVELVIDMFNKREDKLIIVGMGTLKEKLQKKAHHNIHFKEHISDTELAELYTHAKALLVPQEEDFGYVALEAQFFSCPVIFYKKSGIAETIDYNNGSVGVATQTEEAFQHELERFEASAYNVENRKETNLAHFEQFSKSKFINSLLSYITKV